jgi:hypothetical protein
MIVNLFRHTQAVSIISLLALCIFFWVGISMHEVSINDSSWNPLFKALINPINNIHPLKEILTAFLVFWQCLYINKIVVAQKITSTNSFYPALFYFILISFWPSTLTLSSELLATSFILIALNTSSVFSFYSSNLGWDVYILSRGNEALGLKFISNYKSLDYFS